MKNILKLRNIKKIIFNPHLVLIRLFYNLNRLFSDISAFFGMYKYKYNIVFIAGMPASATTLVKNMFGYVPGYFTRHTPMPYEVFVNQNICDSAFKYCPRWGYTIFKTHLNPWDENINLIRKNNVKKVIVTYRDLRDVALSTYYRQLKWPKEKSDPYYMDYSKLSKEEALNHRISIVAKEFIPWMKGWFEISKKYNNFVHFCRFEMLKASPELGNPEEFSKMLEFYEIQLSQKKISEIIEKTRAKGTMVRNLYKVALLPWAFSTNFRSGKTGGWREEFTVNNKKHFKKLAGDFLIELGYEKNNNW